MKTNISNFFKKYLENNNYTGVYAEVQTDKKDSGTAINFKSDTYTTDMRQSEYVKAPFLDAQASKDELKKSMKTHLRESIKTHLKKHKVNGVNTPWYIIPKGFTFLFEKEHEELSDGEAYGRITMKELRKEHLKRALHYFQKACENGISLASKQRIQAIIQNYQRARKSAVKGLKMASTRIFRAVTTETKKEEDLQHKKMAKLNIFAAAESFKEHHGTNNYELCVQRKCSDKKFGAYGSYIFASEHINCPESLIERHIAETYAKWKLDSSFEGVYCIDKEGNIKFYTSEDVQELLKKLRKEQQEYMNTVAA